MKRNFILQCAFTVVFSFMCSTVFSKIIYVSATGSSDSNNGLTAAAPFATLSKATTAAIAGDTIQVSGIIDISPSIPAAGFWINKSITIQGTNKETDGFDVKGLNRLFSIREGCNTKFINLQLKNGLTTAANEHGGAISIVGSSIFNGENLIFKDNESRNGTGGVIYTASTGGIHLKNCIFYNNKALRGGAIGITDSANDRVTFLLENCAFVSNSSTSTPTNGGGSAILVSLGANATNNTINIVNSTFTRNNAASTNGGTIYFLTANNSGNINIINSTITKNTADGNSVNNGAGIYNNTTGLKLNIYNSIIEGNSVTGSTTPMFADLRLISAPSPSNLLIRNSFIGRYAGANIASASDSAAIIPQPNQFNYHVNESGEVDLRAKLGTFNETLYYYPIKESSPAIHFGDFSYLSPYSSTDQIGTARSAGSCSAGAVEVTEISTEIALSTANPDEVIYQTGKRSFVIRCLDSGNLTVALYSISGKKVYAENIGFVTAGEYKEFSFPQAAQGVYILKSVAKDVLSKKIVLL